MENDPKQPSKPQPPQPKPNTKPQPNPKGFTPGASPLRRSEDTESNDVIKRSTR